MSDNNDLIYTDGEATKFDAITIVKSEKYRQYCDLLAVLLNEGQYYTEQEINDIIEQALNTPVKKDVNE